MGLHAPRDQSRGCVRMEENHSIATGLERTVRLHVLAAQPCRERACRGRSVKWQVDMIETSVEVADRGLVRPRPGSVPQEEITLLQKTTLWGSEL